MSYETILYEVRDSVALITLNRPERLNAWHYGMRDDLLDAIARSNADPAVGAMVLTGAGRGFCAGADIEKAFKARLEDGPQEGREDSAATWVRTVRAAKPIVAAVNGVAVGIGRASEAALTARMIGAEEAVASGLADRLVAHDSLLDEALATAGAMAANPDRQLRMVKQLLTQNGSESDLDTVIGRETVLLNQCYDSPEHKEAVAAFLEKRLPVFVRG